MNGAWNRTAPMMRPPSRTIPLNQMKYKNNEKKKTTKLNSLVYCIYRKHSQKNDSLCSSYKLIVFLYAQ